MNGVSTEAEKKASQKYKSKFDRITISMEKGDRAIIRQHAITTGESMNSFIKRAIKETIERDGCK